jgi:insertion element IS1 protein InsB
VGIESDIRFLLPGHDISPDNLTMPLKALLKPFGITRYYTDGWGTYERHVEADKHTVGKENT